MNSEGLTIDDNASSVTNGTILTYKKVLPIFTYKISTLTNDIDVGTDLETAKVLTAQDRSFKKYSESNGLFGAESINRPDVNAVKLGH